MQRIHPILLTDGGQSAKRIVSELVGFCEKAKTSVHIAIFNMLFTEAVGHDLVALLKRKAAAGVDVRIAFDNTLATRANAVSDVKIPGTKHWLVTHFKGSRVQLRAISGTSLMHDKYVVRDVDVREDEHEHDRRSGAVWTGSANFTDDSFEHQENNILVIDVPEIAAFYEKDFSELWKGRLIARTGGDADCVYALPRQKQSIEVMFSPGDGSKIEKRIAEVILAARKRVYVASMVVSSALILSALREVIRARPHVMVRGIVDREQMSAVLAGWRGAGSAATLACWRVVSKRFVEKPSTGVAHDFMHDKVVVADDVVVTGSFNFSHRATGNAENALFVSEPALAARYVEYARRVFGRYS